MKQQQAWRADILILNRLTLHAGSGTDWASGSELSECISVLGHPREWSQLRICDPVLNKPSQGLGGQSGLVGGLCWGSHGRGWCFRGCWNCDASNFKKKIIGVKRCKRDEDFGAGGPSCTSRPPRSRISTEGWSLFWSICFIMKL